MGDRIRPLWKHYYKGADGIIFVIDCKQGYDDNAKLELQRMLDDQDLRDAALLVFANKQDLPNALSIDEVTKRLGLGKLRQRDWYVQGPCASSGDGLYAGLDWLSQTLAKRKN